MNKAFLNWSSGKDAMMALHRINASKAVTVDKLLTTVNADNERVSMHGVPMRLLEQQANALGLTLESIALESGLSLENYNQRMAESLRRLQQENYTHGVFGDILLEDLMKYRKSQYKKIGLEPVFPLWQEDTASLIREFIRLGYKAVVVCVNAKLLDQSFCGRVIDEHFLTDLPTAVDPCGENGEFHTFVFDGPLFANPVAFEVADLVAKDYAPNKSAKKDCFKIPRSWDTKFWFADLRPLG